MIENRRDLSAWVMHFVHDRNPLNNPAFELNEGEETPLFPFHEDWEKNRRFDHWNVIDGDSTLASDDTAFQVLMKILEDGHIRSGWSFRRSKPTIYGPRAACCFTEMPLYALIDYAQRRGKDEVGVYAIGLLRTELFAAGGRPVIYGLSGQHREHISNGRRRPFLMNWPRKLDPACGIAEHEQYRYVAMNLGEQRRIDWGHEREWRWADVADECSCPGLPVWLDEEPHSFSRSIIVVPTQPEAQSVLDKLKELYDAGEHNHGYPYSRETLSNTHVVALDTIAAAVAPERLLTVRLDDLPSSTIKAFERPTVTPKFIKHVEAVLEEAHDAAARAAKDFIRRADKTSTGVVLGDCGFVHLVLCSAQSPLVTALMELEEATVIGGVGYWVSSFSHHSQRQQAMQIEEAAVRAALTVLRRYFPDEKFEIQTRLD